MAESNFSVILDKINNYIRIILPGQRIIYRPDMIFSNEYWDPIEEIQMIIRGHIPSDIFITIRFDSDLKNVIVDFYRLPTYLKYVTANQIHVR